MNEQDLFAVLSEIDDDLLLSPGQPRMRPLHRICLIAAILCALVITAYAAPKIYNAIQSGRIEHTGDTSVEMPDFDSREHTWTGLSFRQLEYTVQIEITPAETIPETIETPYFPSQIPGNWTETTRHINPEGRTLLCQWDVPTEQGLYAAIYQQWPLPLDEAEGICIVPFQTDPGAETECLMHTVGEIRVLEIASTTSPQEVTVAGLETPVVMTIPASRRFFWSDGKYLFCLNVPYELDIGAMEGVISSLSAADLRQIPAADSIQ